MHIPAASPIESVPRNNVFNSLYKLTWGVSLDTILQRMPIDRGAEEETVATAEVPAECLICGGTGPLSDLLSSAFDLRGILVRAEHIEALRCTVERAMGEHGAHITSADDTLPLEITNPFEGVTYSPKGYRGVVIPGLDGDGKSLFLLFVLILRLAAKCTTLYVAEGRGALLFTSSGVSRVVPTATPDDVTPELQDSTWCLVDAPLGRKDLVASLNRFILQVTALRPDSWEWTSRVRSIRHLTKPWTIAELFAARGLQCGPVTTEKQLEEYSMKYGLSPQRAYFYAAEPTDMQESRFDPSVAAVDGNKLAMLRDIVQHATQFDLPPPSQLLFSISAGHHRQQLSISLRSEHLWERLTQLKWQGDSDCFSLHVSDLYNRLAADMRTTPGAIQVMKEAFTYLHLWKYGQSHSITRLRPVTTTSDPPNHTHFKCPTSTGWCLPHRSMSETIIYDAIDLNTIPSAFVDKPMQSYTYGQSVLFTPKDRLGKHDMFLAAQTYNYNTRSVHFGVTVFQTASSKQHIVQTNVIGPLSTLEKLQSLDLVILTLPNADIDCLWVPDELVSKINAVYWLPVPVN